MSFTPPEVAEKRARKSDFLKAIRSNTYGMSSAGIRERFPDVHERSRQRYLNELMDEGLIARLGPRNLRCWTVTDEGLQHAPR